MLVVKYKAVTLTCYLIMSVHEVNAASDDRRKRQLDSKVWFTDTLLSWCLKGGFMGKTDRWGPEGGFFVEFFCARR